MEHGVKYGVGGRMSGKTYKVFEALANLSITAASVLMLLTFAFGLYEAIVLYVEALSQV